MNRVSRPIIASVFVLIALLGQLTVSAFARGADQTADPQYTSSDSSNSPATIRRTRTPRATATPRPTRTPRPTATRRPTRTPHPWVGGDSVDVTAAAIDDGSDGDTLVVDESGD